MGSTQLLCISVALSTTRNGIWQVQILPLVFCFHQSNDFHFIKRRTKMEKQVLDEIIKARSLLVLDHIFWGVLAMRLKLQEARYVPTCCTDGETLFYNPKFILGLTDQERIAVIAHETMHPAMGDLWRFANKDKTLGNLASDYVNNAILLQAGFKLPKGHLYNPAFLRLSKEEVYSILEKEMRPKCNGGQSNQDTNQGDGNSDNQNGQANNYADPGMCGSFFQPKNPTESKEAEISWKTATAAAAQLARGTIPTTLSRLINDEILNPPLPWHILLRDFVDRTARNDYNWTRPNRRYLPMNIILPGLISDELPRVVVAIDTSGSISNELLNRFAAETSAILGSYQTHIHVLHCDAKVHQHDEYDTQDLPIRLCCIGGGGTNFRPVFDLVQKEGITPACLIYLTDLEGCFPVQKPDYPVIWVNAWQNERTAPFGETIKLR
jgi:predicted metal-dependent peptidase